MATNSLFLCLCLPLSLTHTHFSVTVSLPLCLSLSRSASGSLSLYDSLSLSTTFGGLSFRWLPTRRTRCVRVVVCCRARPGETAQCFRREPLGGGPVRGGGLGGGGGLGTGRPGDTAGTKEGRITRKIVQLVWWVFLCVFVWCFTPHDSISVREIYIMVVIKGMM